MKILLSAYACEPNKGSEPGVGWNWSTELSRLGHDVWVLTRENNRNNITSMLSELPESKNLHFIYYDLPQWARWWKKGDRGVRLYYFLWQLGAYFFIKDIHKQESFDKVHHVTFVSVRQPSFMGNLGIPFTFGPVAGGERAPWRLRVSYGIRGWILDGVRDLMNFFIKLDPFMWMTFSQAEKIYVTSVQTKKLLPKQFHKKTTVQLAIGYDNKNTLLLEKKKISTTFKVLYVGRFIYWKGMHLGIPAFAEFLKKVPGARLTMISGGPDKKYLEKIAREFNVYDHIEWLDRIEQSALSDYFGNHDVFLFPSLHDSGGMVVLEAMAHHLPVVCLDLGGPGTIVNNTNGIVISTEQKCEREIIHKICDALVWLQNNNEIRTDLGNQAYNTVSEYRWSSLVNKLYN